MKKIYNVLAALVFATGLTAQIPTNGLIAKYTFNNGSLNDFSGNNHNLTNVSATGTTDPANSSGSALHFNGSSYLYADNMGNMPGSFTASFWVRPNKTAMLAQSGISNSIFSVGGDINVIYNEQSEVVLTSGLWSPSTNGGAGYVTNVRIDDGHWLHITVVYDFNQGVGSNMKFYCNGANLLYSNSYYMVHGQRTPTNKLTIGATLNPNGTVDASSYFNGDIDQVYFYDHALNDTEINALYAEIPPASSTPYFIVTPENADNHVCEGASFSSFAFANGHNLTATQWLFNGNPVGPSGNNLTLDPITSANAGSYYCQANNAAGMNYSEQFSLTVDAAPAITIDLQDTTYVCSTNASESVFFGVQTNNNANVNFTWTLGEGEGAVVGSGTGVNSLSTTVSNGDVINCYGTGNCGQVIFNSTYVKFVDVTAPSVSFDGTTITATGGTYTNIQWYVDGTGLLIGNTTSFTPPQTGNYYAVVYTGSCELTTDTVEVLTIGIAENELGHINLYPNPAQGKLSIKTENNKPGTSVAIYSTQGILLSQTNITGLNTELNIEDLVSGYYFVKINTAKGSSVMSFVKM